MSVEQRSGRCQKFYDDRHLLRTLRGGTKAMRAAGKIYLPQEPGEDAKSYERRLARTTLTNFTRRAIKNLASKPFSKSIVVTSESHQELADEYSAAVDARGTSLNALCSRVFEDAMWQGTSFVAVDRPANGGRPYAYHLSGDVILGYKLDEDDTLAEIRILEKLTVETADYEEKEIGRVRVFRKVAGRVLWDLWEEGEDGKYHKTVDGQDFGLTEIPIMPIHASPVGASGELFSAAPLEDMAYLNLRHYQESSDQANILHVARVPVLFAKGMAEDDKISIGSEYAIKGGENSDLEYVEHSGAAVSAGRQSIIDLEQVLQSYGAEMLQNSGAVETATGRALKAGDNNNQVASLAMNLAAGVEKVFEWISKFNLVSNASFTVDINTDYGINISTEELTALKDARTLGDISREDYLQEMKRRGILRNEFSHSENEDRLATEYV